MFLVRESFMLFTVLAHLPDSLLINTDPNTWSIFAQPDHSDSLSYEEVKLSEVYDVYTISTIKRDITSITINSQLIFPNVIFAPGQYHGNIVGKANITLVTNIYGEVFILSRFVPNTPFSSAPRARSY